MNDEEQVDLDSADAAEAASRTALAQELAAEVRRRVFEEPGLMRLTQVARYGGQVHRASLRPVQLKGVRQFQLETTEGGRVVVRNLDAWYTTFEVQPGQKLYLAPEARIKVW